MREGPLSELFRSTSDAPAEAPAPPAEHEPPSWGREAPTFGSERSNYLAVIKCVGVGGAGVNAVNRMIEAGIRGVEFIAINTDRQSLDQSDADVRLPVGIDITKGRGTGGNASLGEQSLRDSEDQIRRALRGADLVFIAAGEGGGTGTGGAPLVAKLAREMGALTIAVVTRPFAFEGSRRQSMADAGVSALRDQADTIIVIQNDRLLAVLDRGVSMVDAFRVCDDLLRQGVQGITDMITLPGLINLDFADVRTVIRGAGTALLGIGFASGANRAEEAALAAISSPLLETPIDGARGILLGITGGPDLSLTEINRAARVVADAADTEANIIFGATVDPELEGKVWVTVVAAGFTGRRAVAPPPPPQPQPIRPQNPYPTAPASSMTTPSPAISSPFAPYPARGGDVGTPDEPPEAPDLSAVDEPPPSGAIDGDDAQITRLFRPDDEDPDDPPREAG
jgi:cell division protein FtsZ